MDARKVLSFLNFLNTETTGHKEILADLYQRALDEDDAVSHLKNLLDTCVFYNEKGHNLHRDGNQMLKEVYASPTGAPEILPRIRQISERMDREEARSSGLLSSPFPFSEGINVLPNKDVAAYLQMLRKIAGTCVYLMVLYAGPEAIKRLTWNDNVGIQEMIFQINTMFLPALSGVNRPNHFWMIRKKRSRGLSAFDGGFGLSYETAKSIDYQCADLRREAMGTHAFLNIDAYETDQEEVPYCWGTGNIVSCTPDNALRFLQGDIVTKVRAPERQDLSRRMPTPFECMKYLSGGQNFCVPPDVLVKAMNQWKTGNETEKRRKNGTCMFCGRPTGKNRLVCSSHFPTEL